MKDITDAEFDGVLTSGKVLVDFYGTWCQPCKALNPILESLEQEVSDVLFVKLNIDEQPLTPAKHGVTCLPTLILFEDGEEVKRQHGGTSAAKLRDWLGV